MFRARLRARLCRGKEGLHRAPTLSDKLVGIPTSATIFILHPLLSTFSSTFVRNIPTFDHSSTLKRRPQTSLTAAGVCAPPRTIRKWLRPLAFWILRTRAQDPCSCCLIFRTKVDEKVDNSGWRIKIVADVGIPTKLSDKVGARWSPSFPRQSLARRRARNIVQVHAHALNGSWECYHVVRIGLGAIWGDHGRRRSLHLTTPHFV